MKRCSVKPYDGNEKYIFISYCHKDRAQVFPIIEQLAKDGYRVWYDEGIDPGSEWPEIIASHLNKSAVCIAFITDNALNSHNCRREINFALMKMKKLISIILEPVEMSLGMEMQLSATQSIFKYKLSGSAEFFGKLYTAHDLEECKGKPDNSIIISDPSDYEPEVFSDKREPFSDKWFVEDISENKKVNFINKPIPEKIDAVSETVQDAVPEESAPESETAQETVPEESAPESETVQETAPEESAPESETVQETAPEESAPESETAQETVPEESVTEIEAAQETVPEASAPESEAAQETAPEESVPESETAQETVPEESVPEIEAVQEAAPEESAPESETVQETVPEESAPKSETVQEAVPDNSEVGSTTFAPDGEAEPEAFPEKPPTKDDDTEHQEENTALVSDYTPLEKKKKLPMWLKVTAISAAAVAVIAVAFFTLQVYRPEPSFDVPDDDPSVEDTIIYWDESAYDELTDSSDSNDISDVSETSSKDNTSSSVTTKPDKTDSPASKWKESAVSGTKYVTVDCYSREEAIIGSKRADLHKKGSSVKVIAKTDTGYFKLEDGTFIHGDYLSDSDPSQTTSKPQTQKPAVSEQPQTQKPVTEKPQTQKPVTEKPQTQKPVTEKPQTQKPTTDYNPSPAEDFTTTVLSDGTLEISSYIGHDDKVVIPSDISGVKVTSIGDGAFSDKNATNYDTTEIYLPADVESIHILSFYLCYDLKKITVDSNNKYYSSENGVLYNKNKTTLLYCPRDKTGSFTIPDTVTELADYAFAGSRLSNINISASNNIKEIGENTFNYCINLRYFEIPDGVTKIKPFTFYDTPLTTVVIPQSVKEIDKNAFIYDDFIAVRLEKVYYGGTVEEWNKLISGNKILDNAELQTNYKG